MVLPTLPLAEELYTQLFFHLVHAPVSGKSGEFWSSASCVLTFHISGVFQPEGLLTILLSLCFFSVPCTLNLKVTLCTFPCHSLPALPPTLLLPEAAQPRAPLE